ncbi:MAG: prephenate dehydrogenase/arogenate dehydrogenase family protein [Candidatus Pacebacteria bacterium]|nr:prephenate dehydrogenase/arogenate dehydrogenase family protein [Candidatus Paceibacterota bacterium]MDD5357146.1 prephenate dehydrogenase/arogenate dehydrogenase family protein [Candidatus Paceibacterota bacterium]
MKRLKKKHQQSATLAIIGAKGNMGRLLASIFSPLFSVIKIDRESTSSDWRKTWKANIIWLSVPRSSIESLLVEKKFKKEQLVVDVCSLKRGLGAVVARTGATHLSLHPLHGTKVPFIGQRWALIQTLSRGEKHPRGKMLLNFLKEKGISFLPACSEGKHDFMMGITLSIPEMLTIVLEKIIEKYAEDSNRPVPTQEELMQWAVPASNAIFGSYLHLINSTPEWLRNEIVRETPGSLLLSLHQACEEVGGMSLGNVGKKIKAQSKLVRTISLCERDRARDWINAWFVDSTKTLFK